MIRNRGNKQFKSWELELGPFKVSRAPLGASITLWGWGIHVLLIKGRRRLKLRRPAKPNPELDRFVEELGNYW